MPADPGSGLPLHPSTMRRPLLPVLLGAATLVLAPGLVRAHAIQTDLTVVGHSHSHLEASLPAAGAIQGMELCPKVARLTLGR